MKKKQLTPTSNAAEPQQKNGSKLEAYRAPYRREIPKEQDERHWFPILTTDNAITVSVTYYKHGLERLLAKFFDQAITPKPSELEAAATRGRRSLDEITELSGQLYAEDMRRCLANALLGVEVRLAQAISDALEAFCFETVAITLRELDGKLAREFKHPGEFAKIATEASDARRKKRLQTKKGRPKGTEAFKTADDLELAIMYAIRYWLWIGKTIDEITEEDVVKYFEYCPTLPFKPPELDPERSDPNYSAKDQRISEAQQLSRWIKKHKLGGWEAIRERHGVLPDWYVQEHLAELTKKPLI